MSQKSISPLLTHPVGSVWAPAPHLLFITSSSSSPRILKEGCLVCCDTLAISQRAELSSAIETGNDTCEVSVGPNDRKRQLMEDAQNPENVSPNPTLEPHGNGDQNAQPDDECGRCAVSRHQGAVIPMCSDRVDVPNGHGSQRDQRSQQIKGWRSPRISLRIHKVQLVPSHTSECTCLKVTLNISEHEFWNIPA